MKAHPRTMRAESITHRRFGTTDLAIVMGLWSAMAVLLGGVLSELASDTETPMAKSQSEAYALQLAEGKPTRGPASDSSPTVAMGTGVLGKDPWGQPYRYRVVAGGVLVWSLGKNKTSDSDSEIERLISKHAANGSTDFHFAGDDVGYLKVGSAR